MGKQVIKIVNEPMSVNTYILFEEDDNKAVVIDPSFASEKILRVLKDEGLTCEAVLLTHGHFDHIAGVSALRETFGAPLYIHSGDADMITDAKKNMSPAMGGLHIQLEPAENLIKDVDKLVVGNMEILVLGTPGHSPGSVCYMCEEYMFSGDTLFNLSIGRTDLPGGSVEEMRRSMGLLENIDKDYIVHPGHGESSSLEFEKANNPFMGRNAWFI
ncbi:MAG: MBL fold metallo-hydrolase [Christensenellaceae bacterium]|nr:MBL fold metallo-hydrolase [Christensenellaceae bacterium]